MMASNNSLEVIMGAKMIFIHSFIHLFIYYYFLFVVNFVIHWNETAMGLHVFPIPIRPPTSFSTRSPEVFPVHQVRALVSCIQPGLVICFTRDTIHVSTLFSWNIPPSPSPTESKRLFYKSVSSVVYHCIPPRITEWKIIQSDQNVEKYLCLS